MRDAPADLATTVVLTFGSSGRGRVAARCAEVLAALEPEGAELIAVDDGGAADARELAELARRDPRLRVVRLRRHFGQTAALAAGFDRARGAVVVTIDSDGLTDPRDIPALLAAVASGADIVSGRRDVPRSLPTRAGNWLIGAATGVRLHDYGCPLKAYRAEALEELHLYGDMYRFAPAVAFWQGASVTEVPVREHPAQGGRRGAGLRRVVGVLIDLLTVHFLLSYRARPMQAIGRFAGLLLLAALALFAYLGYHKLLLGQDIGGTSLPVLAVLVAVLAGQLLVTGLLAELAVRLYYESQGKPIYVVREEIGAPAPEP